MPDCGGGVTSSSSSGGSNPPLPPIFCHLEPIRTEEIVRLRNDGGGIAIVEHPPSTLITAGRQAHPGRQDYFRS